MWKSIDEIQEKVQRVVKKRRYQHILGVRFTAQAMAMRFGEDIMKAGYAGVLHDCAKHLSDKEMLLTCRKRQIFCSEVEKRQPSLLHAKLGAVFAKEIYGITDEEILSAIRWHTTGKPGMTKLEKIVFIADFIEPGRKMLPRMEEIRTASFQDLDKAMYLILDNTLSYLKDGTKDRSTIDTYSVDAYDYYKERNGVV
ncbi:MAG TPA: phosphodiesterase [Lachnospiraceae bacterium]|nr:phosphodiesterase [Lachnospiraceae bacterium]